jgi:hypothetical protein
MKFILKERFTFPLWAPYQRVVNTADMHKNEARAGLASKRR